MKTAFLLLSHDARLCDEKYGNGNKKQILSMDGARKAALPSRIRAGGAGKQAVFDKNGLLSGSFSGL